MTICTYQKIPDKDDVQKEAHVEDKVFYLKSNSFTDVPPLLGLGLSWFLGLEKCRL